MSNFIKLEDLPVCANPDITLYDITNVNFKPHPYCIGTSHINFANEGYRLGILSEDVIEEGERLGKVKCAVVGCNLPYKDHKSDRVLFLKVKGEQELKDVPGLQDYLKELAEIVKDEIDGFAFVKG